MCKLITRSGKYDHVSGILKHLHWLAVSERIDLKMLLLTYKSLITLAPTYLRDLLSFHFTNTTLLSTDNMLLHVLKSRLKTYGDRSFKCAAPKLWNEPPLEIRLSHSVCSIVVLLLGSNSPFVLAPNQPMFFSGWKEYYL